MLVYRVAQSMCNNKIEKQKIIIICIRNREEEAIFIFREAKMLLSLDFRCLCTMVHAKLNNNYIFELITRLCFNDKISFVDKIICLRKDREFVNHKIFQSDRLY